MALDRFLIAPLNSGLVKDKRPWLIADDAFEILQNAYVFHGRVKKRFGTTYMNGAVDEEVGQQYTRLRIEVDTTDGAGAASGTVPGSVFAIGQMFSIGDEMFTVNNTGTPANLISTGGGTGTYNTTTGAYTFSGAAATTEVYFYPGQPVMGLTTYEVATINDEQYIAFDQQFAYRYTGGAWTRIGTAVWTGDNADFFQACNWRGAQSFDYLLFVTNYVAADQIKYWDGSSWTTINPQLNAAAARLETGRIILPFKDRLVVLNTIETTGTYVNRCRFSQNGSPLEAEAFREDISGRGGYLDAATREAIVSAQFLRDKLIVFFERSTWELIYTGNEVLPFRWQKINTELGVESTFSIVPFDKAVLGIGNVGIHACNGISVERIDEKIHDDVYQIHNGNDGVFRVHGIRDYRNELVYWTFPSIDSAETDPTFPNRILVYNYETGAWAYNDDSFTTFGYYQNDDDITWENTDKTWQEYEDEWDTGTLQSREQRIIAGNQQGFVLLIDAIGTTRNAPALQITDMSISGTLVTITAINHNLTIEDFVLIEYAQGITGANDQIFPVNSITDLNTFVIQTSAVLTGTYTGGGTIARVSRIDILTKQYNFYLDKGYNASVERVNFFVDRTANGVFNVDIMPSTSNISLIEDGINSGALLGDNTVQTSAYADIPLEQTQTQLWHPFYTQANGEFIQLRLYIGDELMIDTNVAMSDFQLHAMLFYAQPTSSRLQ